VRVEIRPAPFDGDTWIGSPFLSVAADHMLVNVNPGPQWPTNCFPPPKLLHAWESRLGGSLPSSIPVVCLL
jgi:hypothetical protein